MTKKVGLASDHAGFQIKEVAKEFLTHKGYDIVDYGTNSEASVDYPDYAHTLAKGIESQEVDLGIAVCGSGQGISITLNKHQNVRAALSWNVEIATLARKHNNANVLSLPGRFLNKTEAEAIIEAFLNTEFEGGRHEQRIKKIPCICP